MYISIVLNPNMSECFRGPKEKQNKTKNTIILNIGGEGFTYPLAEYQAFLGEKGKEGSEKGRELKKISSPLSP